MRHSILQAIPDKDCHHSCLGGPVPTLEAIPGAVPIVGAVPGLGSPPGLLAARMLRINM